MLNFISLEDCRKYIFPIIRENLAAENNPAPLYENETVGLKKLEAVFSLAKNHTYYEGFFEKATYLFLSILSGHFFSNGNKRLALSVFVKFYEINGYRESRFKRDKYVGKLKEIFPKAKIRKIPEIQAVFPEMLYHLTKIVADKKSRGDGSFDSLKSRVEDFFRFSLTT